MTTMTRRKGPASRLMRATLHALGIAMAMLPSAPYAVAQCPLTIDVFPHLEDFESGPVWTSGGAGSDWAWGTPAKPVISGAASGSRCWVIGGLTNSWYIDSQQSWVMGPCYDFSALTNPWISFKVLWECERDFDGLSMQYSLNGGATWTNVGAFGAPAHCLAQNWFNTQYISNLTLADPRQGWSGRIGPTQGACVGGSGSVTWVTASQCLQNLAGQPSVRFRFVFGAGSTCNSYDGVAIDDFLVGEAPPNQADFIYGCDGNMVEFTNTSALCPTSFAWNFGDPASGAANTSTQASPQHTYTAPGTYTVTFTVSGPCNAPSTVVRQISILEVDFDVLQPTCGQANGTITAQVTGSNVPISYQWNPGGGTTATITGLSPGIYGVQVSAPDACPAQATVLLEASTAGPVVQLSSVDLTCHGSSDGSVTGSITGGTGPYSIVWQPALGAGLTHTGLGPGIYVVTVTDADGCEAIAQVTIAEPDTMTLAPPADAVICAGEALLLAPQVSGGTPPYTIGFLPDGPLVSPASTTTYTMTVADAQGCTAGPVEVNVQVSTAEVPALSVDEATGCVPHCVQFSASTQQAVQLDWNFGDGGTANGTIVRHCFGSPGTYAVSVTATNADDCTVAVILEEPIVAIAPPVALFTADPPITTIGSPTVQFSATASTAIAWDWTIGVVGDTLEGLSVVYTFEEVECHPLTLRVTDEAGCTSEAEGIYCVEDDFGLWAPNAFTPDGDGVNDVFGVVTTVGDPGFFELAIYDRWGRLLFSALDKQKGWDGSASGIAVAQGVYVWQVRLHDTFGGLQERAGHVTLIR